MKSLVQPQLSVEPSGNFHNKKVLLSLTACCTTVWTFKLLRSSQWAKAFYRPQKMCSLWATV